MEIKEWIRWVRQEAVDRFKAKLSLKSEKQNYLNREKTVKKKCKRKSKDVSLGVCNKP